LSAVKTSEHHVLLDDDTLPHQQENTDMNPRKRDQASPQNHVDTKRQTRSGARSPVPAKRKAEPDSVDRADNDTLHQQKDTAKKRQRRGSVGPQQHANTTRQTRSGAL
jgi:hypothetical protein